MSGFILLLLHFMNTNTPTILYAESTQYPTSWIPFPAVTICNLNRISNSKALSLATKLHKPTDITSTALADHFKLALSLSENITASTKEYQQLSQILQINNYTLSQLLDEITPDCETELLRCKWKSRFENCHHLFQKVRTSYGICCGFNYKALRQSNNIRTDYTPNDNVEYVTSCGYKTGLSILLDPQLNDYKAVLTATPGFLVLVHDALDFPDFTASKSIITTKKFNKIIVKPQQTHSTDYVKSKKIHSRRCYLPAERHLFNFGAYSPTNCLAECRSSVIYEKCHCVPPNWPKKQNWTVCDLKDSYCIKKYKYLLDSKSQFLGRDHYLNGSSNRFRCDCYPLCDFNMYNIAKDSGRLKRKYSLTDKEFFKSINITNHTLLHVFYDKLYAERLRLDVFENWLSYIGTFGGITGLYMGYSFLSGFELIFFVFVRPACNWLTKKQIKYRIEKRQKKAQLEAVTEYETNHF